MSRYNGITSTVTLRPVGPEDERFVFEVYSSTRAEELSLVDWAPEQKHAFLQMQFDAQRRHYLSFYPHAAYHVILVDAERVGRLIVDRSPAEILLMDIALLPGYRGHGTGTELIKALMLEAERAHQAVRLHVETFNRALHLYERLGFRKVDESGIYCEMLWKPLA